MKQLLATIALLVMAVSLWPQSIMIVKKKAAGACTSPTGTTISESFGDASTSCWSGGPATCGNTWTVSGSNSSIATSQSGAPDNTVCPNALEIAASATTEYIYIAHAGSQATPIDIYGYVRVASTTMADFAIVNLIGLNDGTPTGNARGNVNIRHTTGTTYQFRALTTNGDALVLGTWYKVKLHLEDGASASYMQIDDGTPTAFTQGAYDGDYIRIGLGTSNTITFQWGVVWVD